MHALDKLIRLYVVENDTTMNWVSSQLGMSKDALCMRRKGKTQLSFAEANEISKLLDMTLDELAEAIL